MRRVRPRAPALPCKASGQKPRPTLPRPPQTSSLQRAPAPASPAPRRPARSLPRHGEARSRSAPRGDECRTRTRPESSGGCGTLGTTPCPGCSLHSATAVALTRITDPHAHLVSVARRERLDSSERGSSALRRGTHPSQQIVPHQHADVLQSV